MSADDARCEECEKPVHLLHDPPQECGVVRCPECSPCDCLRCEDGAS